MIPLSIWLIWIFAPSLFVRFASNERHICRKMVHVHHMHTYKALERVNKIWFSEFRSYPFRHFNLEEKIILSSLYFILSFCGYSISLKSKCIFFRLIYLHFAPHVKKRIRLTYQVVILRISGCIISFPWKWRYRLPKK